MAGVLILIFWGAFVNNVLGLPAGLVERLSAGSHALWLSALTVALVVQRRRRSRSFSSAADGDSSADILIGIAGRCANASHWSAL